MMRDGSTKIAAHLALRPRTVVSFLHTGRYRPILAAKVPYTHSANIRIAFQNRLLPKSAALRTRHPLR